MIPHEIKLKNGNHIHDTHIRDEVCHILDNDLDFSYIDNHKISVVSDKRNEKERVTIVEVER